MSGRQGKLKRNKKEGVADGPAAAGEAAAAEEVQTAGVRHFILKINAFGMTEYVDKSNEEMVSEFIVGTCQLSPKLVSFVSDKMHDLEPSQNPVPNSYPILCGSAAEFYIRPLNTCIDDADFLSIRADQLVFSGDFHVLPSDRSGLADTIQFGKLEPYHEYPGFVRLRYCGQMNYNWKCREYEFSHIALPNRYSKLNLESLASGYSFRALEGNSTLNTVSGPAIKYRGHYKALRYFLGFDIVKSIWCPQWPDEALGWLQRPRNNGWPTKDTIAEVIQNGCHVVYVQHRACRDDKIQWRFSFSVAEVVLLQSWTKIQQIVYHLLRFFAKKELIQKNCPKEDEILCSYHLKTLMLWTCEEMSPEWWNSSSVISICCALLKKLSEWLKKGHYPNYFIPEANLFHRPSRSKMLGKTEKRLNEFRNSGLLCHWFVENYILYYIKSNFEVTGTLKETKHFMNYMPHLLEFWKANKRESLDLLFFLAFSWSHQNSRSVIKYRCSSGLRHSLKIGYLSRCIEPKTNWRLLQLPTLQKVSCFKYYDILLYILHVAYCLDCEQISWDSSLFVEFVEAISMQPRIIRSKYHNFPKTYTIQSCRFKFIRAQDLMQNLTGSNCRSESELLSLMSKEFLRKALEYDDCKSNGIASAALAYLAALHFVTADYQQAIRLCLAVLEDQSSDKEKETLNEGCLLFIDDVARIVGLYVLHKKITYNELHYIGGRLYLDLRLSPEMFAHYLAVLAAGRIAEHFNFYDFHDSAFPMDKYLNALIKPQCVASVKSGTHCNASRQRVCCETDLLAEAEDTTGNRLIAKETVIGVLMEYAVENMTSFYNLLLKDFDIHCDTAVCYRLLHLYQCREYDEVMHLCELFLHEPDLPNNMKKCSWANVLVIPPLDSFFDSDVQSLLGFHTLFYYFLSTLNKDIEKVVRTPEMTLANWFAYNMDGPKLELSCFLQCDYSIKCHYFLGRHFLARYLKVRCCIDCTLPYEEALTEFADQKIILPFEHIIRKFLLQKLRKYLTIVPEFRR